MQPTRFEIPEQMRETADRSVDEARKAFDRFLEATLSAMATAEGQARSFSAETADLGRQSLSYAEENITASFDFAKRLVQARTLEEMTALQQEFVRRQVAAVAEQGKDIGERIGKVAGAAMKNAQKASKDAVTPKPAGKPKKRK